MGNSQSNPVELLLQDYQRIDTFDDSRFGTVTIAKSVMNGQLIWVKEGGMVLEAKLDLEPYMNSIRQDKEYFRIFNTIDFGLTNAQNTFGYCTHEMWKSIVVVQHFDKTLEIEIEQRAQLNPKQFFQEEEIWLMFDALQEVEIHCRSHNRIHSDLRLSNIFIAEDGSIKFLDTFLLNWKLNGLTRHFIDGAKVPISPEKIPLPGAIKHNEEWTSEDEVWTLGIILLSMASLKKDSQDFYNWRNFTINRKGIDQALDEVRYKYSQRLYLMLFRCLQMNRNERLTIQEFVNTPGSALSVRNSLY